MSCVVLTLVPVSEVLRLSPVPVPVWEDCHLIVVKGKDVRVGACSFIRRYNPSGGIPNGRTESDPSFSDPWETIPKEISFPWPPCSTNARKDRVRPGVAEQLVRTGEILDSGHHSLVIQHMGFVTKLPPIWGHAQYALVRARLL